MDRECGGDGGPWHPARDGPDDRSRNVHDCRLWIRRVGRKGFPGLGAHGSMDVRRKAPERGLAVRRDVLEVGHGEPRYGFRAGKILNAVGMRKMECTGQTLCFCRLSSEKQKLLGSSQQTKV